MGHPNEWNALAAQLLEPAAGCLVARVERVDAKRVELSVAAGRVSALPALSCLMALEAGDTVAVIRDPSGAHYVTAVLHREATGPLELFTAHALSIRSAQSVHFSAGTSIELDAGERVRVRAPLFEALVGRFVAFAKTLSVNAGEAVLTSKAAKVCSELIDIAAQRIGLSARHSHRQIDGSEQLRCRYFDLRADELMHLRAKTALVKAADLAKIDAAQIQIG